MKCSNHVAQFSCLCYGTLTLLFLQVRLWTPKSVIQRSLTSTCAVMQEFRQRAFLVFSLECVCVCVF